MRHSELLMEKIRESLRATLPITAIVLVLAVTIAPLTPGTLVLFLFGALLLVVGMGLFTLGVDMSMIPMGDGIGVAISRAKKITPPLLVCLILGIVVTVAEPDLQVLAEQLPGYIGEVTLALLPVVAIFGLFQLPFRRFHRRQLGKILVGLLYTYAGLVLFLVGVNVGFMPAGATIGASIASSRLK